MYKLPRLRVATSLVGSNSVTFQHGPNFRSFRNFSKKGDLEFSHKKGRVGKIGRGLCSNLKKRRGWGWGRVSNKERSS